MDTPVINGYTILGKIAEGGMATVWKAKQNSLDRLVALKVLNPGLIKSDADIARFMREAQAAAKMKHAGLCEIYDAGEANGVVYYVMEYVAGFSLGQLLERKGDLKEKQALLIVAGAASILAAIWEKYQVIHCDIKPDNLLINQDGTICVTDLGLARMMGRMSNEEDRDYIVGTPNYMSPEQARGAGDLDVRADIYGLGATLYHMLTGLMPFANSEGEAAMERQINDYLGDPLAINPDISIYAACLLEKMMIKDRQARYASWSDLIKDVEEVRQGRLPRGELVPAGQSTVSRSEEREAATLKEIQAMKPKRPAAAASAAQPPVPRSPSLGAKKPLKKGGARPRLKGQSPGAQARPVASASAPVRDADPWGAVAGRSVIWLLIVVGAYAATYFWMNRAPATMAADEPPVAVAEQAEPSPIRRPEPVRTTEPAPSRPAPAATPSPAPAREPARTPTVTPAPAAETETEPATATEPWDHPDYVEAMRLLRDAEQQFQRFLAERDQALLDDIEPQCRQAIRLLESVRGEAPPRAQVGERIRLAYQLINNSRHSRTLAQ